MTAEKWKQLKTEIKVYAAKCAKVNGKLGRNERLLRSILARMEQIEKGMPGSIAGV
ncbi:MAG: hypothetical protein GX279_09960 [Clostridiaceae bacterium]|nr:hypothetical protein [Clostridiaceae bacterium]